MTEIEIQNRINQVLAAINQMRESELFNENEIRDNLNKYNTELEHLYLLQAKNIDVNNPEEQN